MPETPFYMVKLRLDAARLARELAMAGLPPGQEDTGLLVHHLLAGLFGEGSIQPFRITDEHERWLAVLGYAHQAEAELRQHALTFAEPDRYAACDWEGFAAKPMPDLAAGALVGFELRACPIVRLASAVEIPGKKGEPLKYRCGAEVDAWVYERRMARERGEDRTRDQVYAQWLRNRLSAAADVESVRIDGFNRLRLVRRSHQRPRHAKPIERPQAILRGELRVRDAPAFTRLLERGVGRHRAYGFGMLLLRPPERC